MQVPYRQLDDKPYESIYLHAETIIDQPIEKVWHCALEIDRWMNAHRLEPLAGESGAVGRFERVYPQTLGDEVGQPRYHLYGIGEIVPYKLIALEVLPERGGSYGSTREWMSFDSMLFVDLGERTQLIFLMVDVHMGRGEKDFRARRKTELEEARAMLERYFENLKRNAEQL